MTDIAFAVDSVLAGVATIKGPDKLWVVYLGAIIGIVALRFAAGYFIRLLERFPALDTMAYVLVGWVGVKLAFMAVHNYAESVVKAGGTPVVNLPAMPTWLFWTVLGTIVVLGTIYAKRSEVKVDDSSPETDAEEVEALMEGETVEPIPGTEVVEEPAPETRS
jgi:predicted tellurium resistance membrane protein TerC